MSNLPPQLTTLSQRVIWVCQRLVALVVKHCNTSPDLWCEKGFVADCDGDFCPHKSVDVKHTSTKILHNLLNPEFKWIRYEEWMYRPISQSINQSINQSLSVVIKLMFHNLLNPMLKKKTMRNEWMNESTNQSINQSINQIRYEINIFGCTFEKQKHFHIIYYCVRIYLLRWSDWEQPSAQIMIWCLLGTRPIWVQDDQGPEAVRHENNLR